MPRRIALVEDEPAIRANYVDALRRHGYEVSAYAGRREAMEAGAAAFVAKPDIEGLIDAVAKLLSERECAAAT